MNKNIEISSRIINVASAKNILREGAITTVMYHKNSPYSRRKYCGTYVSFKCRFPKSFALLDI